MSRTVFQAYTSQALNATGLASGVAYANGGYALNAVSSPDGLGHLITFANLSANSHTGQNITFSGLDENGSLQSETLAGPAGNATITTVGHYQQNGLTIAASATTGADTFNVGWTADAVGKHIHLELDRDPVVNAEIFCVVPSGSPTFGIDYTADLNPTGLVAKSWLAHATIAGKSATFDGQITTPVKALRLHFTAAGTVNMTVIEPYHA